MIDAAEVALRHGAEAALRDSAACAYPVNTPLSGYVYGCRCDRCKGANNAYHREYNRAHPRQYVPAPPRPRKPPPPRVPLVDRVMRRVVVNGAGCWIWQGATHSNGYGAVKDDAGRVTSPHRVMVQHRRGPIPAGMHVDHLCAVRACCNPDHLDVVTPVENDRRARARLAT